MSPGAQYLKSSALSLYIVGVMELEIPIDESIYMPFLRELFIPINHRFSSIMVFKERGEKKWKRVEVNLKDHVNVPVLPSGLSTDYYDECFNEYLSKLAWEQLPESRPLWEVHIFNYPTKHVGM
ncbi:O-acyltransferase WSD1-like [Olea europaea subsp. europaea]|uniref:O-acyltransferase WSD1-like n=1 Tax=Olea europaea subsp. europaea TaxID=158383 RepID=A0A8S0UZ11_OLEEU|nr:O-acyltransferase WSD1-like [Olea europaea subsp. europaea]